MPDDRLVKLLADSLIHPDLNEFERVKVIYIKRFGEIAFKDLERKANKYIKEDIDK